MRLVVLFLLVLTGVANAQCPGGISQCPSASTVAPTDFTVLSQPGGTGPTGFVTRKATVQQFLTGAFNPAAPGNAAYFLTCPNAPIGYSTLYNCVQTSQGTPLPAGQQWGSNTVGAQQGLVSTLSVAPGDAASSQFSVASYLLMGSTSTAGAALFGAGLCGIQSCGEIDGANVVVTNANKPNGGIGFDAPLMLGFQCNPNVQQKAGGINPIVGLNCFYAVGGGNATNNTGSAFVIDQLSITTGAKWTAGLFALNGCCVTGVRLGAVSGTAAAVPTNSGSQPLVFDSYLSGGLNQVTISVVPAGDLLIAPVAGHSVIIQPLPTAPLSGSGTQLCADTNGRLYTRTPC